MRLIDLTGTVFGKLTVLGPAPRRKGATMWLCSCTCGRESEHGSAVLRRGTTKSCGCGQGTPLQDLTGLVFGRLTVLRRADGKAGKPRWECACSCGRIHITWGSSLRNGNTKSCGCINGSNKYATVEEANAVRAYDIYSRGAKTRGYEWSLTLEQFSGIVRQPCVYCGAPPEERPSRWKAAPTTRSSGIDRIDNTQGYTPTNVAPCCTRCNIAKRHYSMTDFISHCRAVAARFPEVGL